jgi:hypothetical protein
VSRALKSELGLRPVQHRTAERAEGHPFIAEAATRGEERTAKGVCVFYTGRTLDCLLLEIVEIV